MIPVLDTNAWIEKLRELERPGADNILAFYEHRFGAVSYTHLTLPTIA